MRSARDLPPALGTNTSLLQSSGPNVKDHLTESLTWCCPDTSRWKHTTARARVCVYVCAWVCHMLKILPHMQAHSRGLDSIVEPHSCVCVCVCVCVCMKEKPAHTLHCDAWVASTLPELIQSLGHIHFLQYLKHIIEGRGRSKWLHANKSQREKGYTVLNGAFPFISVGFFSAQPLIYSTSTGSRVLKPCWFIEDRQLPTAFYKY